MELEVEVSKPDLWDDQDRARKVNTELAQLQRRRRRWSTQLDGSVVRPRDAARARARRERRVGRERDRRRGWPALGRQLDTLELRALFTGEHDDRDAICTVQLRRRRYRRAGLDQHAAAHVPALGRATRLRRRDRRGVSRAPRRASARRRSRSRVATPSACSRASAACTGSSASRRSTRTRVARPPSRRSTRARARRGGGAGDRPDRPAHRHVPVVGRRRSARQRHRLRRPHHPRPTGIVVSCQNERSQTQNKARAMQILAARLAERQRQEREAELEALAGDKRDVAFGNQIRTYTLQPVPAGEGRAHPLRDRQRAGRARRRPRRVHRGVPPLAPPGRVDAARRRPPDTEPQLAPATLASLDMIRFENVSKIYKGDVAALRDVSAEVQKGEFVFLVGPVGLREVHVPAPPPPGGAGHDGPHRRGGPRHLAARATGRSRSSAATSAASSRTSSCCPTRPSTRTSPSPWR